MILAENLTGISFRFHRESFYLPRGIPPRRAGRDVISGIVCYCYVYVYARAFQRCWLNRPLRRLDRKLNYKDPDWLDPPEAYSVKKTGLSDADSPRDNNF